MLESVGSKASQETWPGRGWTLAQVAAEVLVPPMVVRWMNPPAVPVELAPRPARTRLESVGATAMALPLGPPACKVALAWVQLPAALLVRHILLPPIQSRLELLGSMMKGAMKKKLPPDSVIPLVASAHSLCGLPSQANPTVHFWI